MAPTSPSRIQQALGGPRTLGRRLTDENGLIEASREGIPHASLEALRKLLGLSSESVGTALGLAPRTLARRKKQRRLTPQESDRLIRFARVAAFAVEVLGDSEKASHWFQESIPSLGGVTPLSCMDTDTGVRQVEQALGRIDHGIVS